MALLLQVISWQAHNFLLIFLEWYFWIMVLATGLIQYRMTRDPVQAGSLVLSSLGAGILGGSLGSLIFLALGITVDVQTCGLMLAFALCLMFIRPRFICFSYAGGLLSMSYLIFGFPQVDVPQLMALVAVLHWIEAILIRLTGIKGAKATMIKASDGQWRQGYELNMFWPLPLVALMATYASPEVLQQSFSEMPSWWPLIAANAELVNPNNQDLLAAGGELLYTLVPVVAVLGYSDKVAGMSLKQRVNNTSIELLIYSFILLALCWIASHYIVLSFLPAIFAPLAHDFLIQRKK